MYDSNGLLAVIAHIKSMHDNCDSDSSNDIIKEEQVIT